MLSSYLVIVTLLLTIYASLCLTVDIGEVEIGKESVAHTITVSIPASTTVISIQAQEPVVVRYANALPFIGGPIATQLPLQVSCFSIDKLHQQTSIITLFTSNGPIFQTVQCYVVDTTTRVATLALSPPTGATSSFGKFMAIDRDFLVTSDVQASKLYNYKRSSLNDQFMFVNDVDLLETAPLSMTMDDNFMVIVGQNSFSVYKLLLDIWTPGTFSFGPCVITYPINDLDIDKDAAAVVLAYNTGTCILKEVGANLWIGQHQESASSFVSIKSPYIAIAQSTVKILNLNYATVAELSSGPNIVKITAVKIQERNSKLFLLVAEQLQTSIFNVYSRDITNLPNIATSSAATITDTFISSLGISKSYFFCGKQASSGTSKIYVMLGIGDTISEISSTDVGQLRSCKIDLHGDYAYNQEGTVLPGYSTDVPVLTTSSPTIVPLLPLDTNTPSHSYETTNNLANPMLLENLAVNLLSGSTGNAVSIACAECALQLQTANRIVIQSSSSFTVMITCIPSEPAVSLWKVSYQLNKQSVTYQVSCRSNGIVLPQITQPQPAVFGTFKENIAFQFSIQNLLSFVTAVGSSGIGLTSIVLQPGNQLLTNIACSNGINCSKTKLSTISASAALLFGSNDQMQLIPNFKFGGTVTLMFHAWNGQGGNAGEQKPINTVNFSANSVQVTVKILNVNNNPTFSVPIMNVPPILENASNLQGVSVLSVVQQSFNDVDPSAKPGIIITGSQTSFGTWFYCKQEINPLQCIWKAMPDFIASVVLLGTLDKIKFEPTSNNQQFGEQQLIVHAWDMQNYANKAGEVIDLAVTPLADLFETDSFSIAAGTIVIVVNKVDDEPVIRTTTTANVKLFYKSKLPLVSITDIDSNKLSLKISVTHGKISSSLITAQPSSVIQLSSIDSLLLRSFVLEYSTTKKLDDVLVLRVTDGTSTVTFTMDLVVEVVNNIINVKAGGPYEKKKEGQQLLLQGTVSALPGVIVSPNVFTWQITNANGFKKLLTGKNVAFKAPQFGTDNLYDVVFTAEISNEITFNDKTTLSIVNVAPVVTLLPSASTIVIGRSLLLKATVVDESPIASISWSNSKLGANQLRIVGNSATFEAVEVGQFKVHATATDNFATSIAETVITVVVDVTKLAGNSVAQAALENEQQPETGAAVNNGITNTNNDNNPITLPTSAKVNIQTLVQFANKAESCQFLFCVSSGSCVASSADCTNAAQVNIPSVCGTVSCASIGIQEVASKITREKAVDVLGSNGQLKMKISSATPVDPDLVVVVTNPSVSELVNSAAASEKLAGVLDLPGTIDTLMNIDLVSASRGQSAQPSAPLTVVVVIDNNDSPTLYFFNEETEDWEIADGNPNFLGKGQFEFTLNHLTTFAVLLDGGSGSGESSDGQKYVIQWLSLASILFALLVVFVAMAIIEGKMQYSKRKEARELRAISQHASAAPTSL